MSGSTAVEARSRRALPPAVRGVVGFCVLALVAETVSRSGLVNPAFVPPISLVLLRLAQQLVEPGFLLHLLATVRAWALGLGLALGAAVPLGVILGSFSAAYTGSRALIEFLRPIPSVALIPLAILLFGRGDAFKASLVLYAATWPILFNTIYGMHDVDPIAKDTARAFGFGRLAILRKVSLPSAAPFVYTGVRVSAAIALIVTISAELIGGSPQGLGSWIAVSQAGGRPDLVFAGVILAGALGWALNWGLVKTERRFLSWQPALRSSSS